MSPDFYRYVSYPLEVDQIIRERRVQSTNPNTGYATWYTPTRYDDPTRAQQDLALPNTPTHRIGPIHDSEIPNFDVKLRVVRPAFGQPGGGLETRTKSPVWIFGVWNFQNMNWDL